MAEFKLARIQYTWKGVWSNGTGYLRDDIVVVGASVYTCLVQHTSAVNFYADLNSGRWELTAKGNTWRGAWSALTYYNVNDVMAIAGAVYRCITAHESQVNLISWNPANWEVLFLSINWRGEWAPNTEYITRDVVKYSGNIYVANRVHISDATLLDNNLDNWDILISDDAWHGDWITATRYQPGDIVRFYGNVYICISAHTSSELNSQIVNWEILFEGINYVGDWVSDTVYQINDIVKYGPTLYKSLAFQQVVTFSSGNWEIFVPGTEFSNTWSSIVQYITGNIVSYSGNLYYALTDNQGANPSVAVSDWELLFEGTTFAGSWRDFINYRVGSIVNYGGNAYVALQDSIDQAPDIPEDGLDYNPTFWQILVSGVAWKGTWDENINYANGDAVVLRGSAYKCIEAHYSSLLNSPDDDPLIGMGTEAGGGDSTSFGTYWQRITQGDRSNVLKKLGDLKTFDLSIDGSSIGPIALEAGSDGQALTVSSGSVNWTDVGTNTSVYYVNLDGEDSLTRGTTKTSAWRTVRYACEQVTGPATIFIGTGTYEEILPIRVPAFVALVGDELRSTKLTTANKIISDSYLSKITDACSYLSTAIIGDVLNEATIDPTYTTSPQIKLSDPPDSGNIDVTTALIDVLNNFITSKAFGVSISGSNPISVDPERIKVKNSLTANRDFIIRQTIGYLEFVDNGFIAPSRMYTDIEKIILSLEYDTMYPGNWKTYETGIFFINGNDYEMNQRSNMFLLRDGCGVRNMTLAGLEGILLPGDANPITRRPNGGAFASLDPGWGPEHEECWVGTRSPYVQNVTTFGEACIGLKIDGDLHNGGNQTIVANDFTQIISDGIGVWANKTGKTEVVSVFTYYNHIGYMSTNGGKIRGTNGNCSYGNFGALSEGFDTDETPITAFINNRYYDASVATVFSIGGGQISNLFYSNAGINYTTASATFLGNGLNVNAEFDETRDGSVFEVRITDPGDSSAAGGSGYVFVTNAAQLGDSISIQIAGSDENTVDTYRNMRIVISRGTGVGQYAYIVDFDDISKMLWVGNESKSPFTVSATTDATDRLTIAASDSSFDLIVNQPVMFTGDLFGNVQVQTVYYIKTIESPTQITISDTEGGSTFDLSDASGTMTMHCLGWENFNAGQPIESILDSTTNYEIEPRLIFSTPGFSASSYNLPSSANWESITFGADKWVAIAYNNENAISSIDGQNWNTYTIGAVALWSKIKYVGGKFVALAIDGTIAVSDDAITWTLPSVPVLEYRDVAYGGGKWVFVASGTTSAVTSTDLTTFSTITLPEGADWNAIEYGKGKFVVVSLSDSSSNNALYSSNASAWTAFSIPGSIKSMTFGNNKFVAIAGGYSSAEDSFYSFNGTVWYQGENLRQANWSSITYGQGMFAASADGESYVAISKDGYQWKYENISETESWKAVSFGANNSFKKYVVIGGTDSVSVISTGATTQARSTVIAGRISLIRLWEPGSGYSSAPAIEIIDPNNSSEVTYVVRTGDRVLANPTFVDPGEGYSTTSTTVSITGDGFKDEYHLGDFIVVSNLSRNPGPGDNLRISSVQDYIYKVLQIEILEGLFPNVTARLRIAKELDRDETPEHNTEVTIRQNYSQVRLTGHDFLDIGLGNFEQTNYPDTLFPNGTILAPENEVFERDGGRVFYTSTDQDGNFRVGELFAVEQATGTVTLNAQFFELSGLEEIAIGGVTVGGTGVVVREFSTDPLFVADSNNIIPTQKAIRSFLNRRVSGGGSDAITGQILCGQVIVGPQQITNVVGASIIVDTKMNFKQPIDGVYLGQMMMLALGND